MKNKLASFLILGIFLYSNAYASTRVGTIDCGMWNQEKSEMNKTWLNGYMTGLSVANEIATDNKSNPLGKITSTYQIWSWMDNYCQKNPLNNLAQGGHELFEELKKK